MNINIPFYQTEWHGIDLVALAKEIKHPLNRCADSRFYDAFYAKLYAHEISQSWKQKKKKVSDWLLNKLIEFSLANKKILSIGAGTGIVEIPLIEKGIDIHLHDVQSNSFAITGVDKKTRSYAGNLSNISQKYDALVSIAACYTLSDKQMAEFFYDCANLLNKDGILIVLDTSLSWYEVYSYMRNRSYLQKNCLLWGRKRNITSIRAQASRYFALKNFSFYDEDINLVKARTFLTVPFNLTPTWQALIFERKA